MRSIHLNGISTSCLSQIDLTGVSY